MLLGSSAMGLVSPTIPFFLKATASAQQVLNVVEKKELPEESMSAKITLDKNTVIGNLSFKEVAFCYPERPTITVLDLLSLDIPENRTTAVVGPSGSGKSTIIGLIERWYTPSEGSITLDGVDIGQIDISALRDQIGLVQQVRFKNHSCQDYF
jgi:ATP-binding cassette, subfamily B (MDR/TAP), member 1